MSNNALLSWATGLGQNQQSYLQQGLQQSLYARPVKMTAADLGLPCDCDRIDCPECHRRWQAKHEARARNPLDGTRLWDNSDD